MAVDDNEFEWKLKTSADQKTVWIKISSGIRIDTQELAWILDYFAKDLGRALKVKSKQGDLEH